MSTTFLNWTAYTPVEAGQIILPTTQNGFWYLVETAGTTAASEPTFSTAVDGLTTDNTVAYRTRKSFVISIEASGGDYNTLSGAETANQPDLITALVFDHGGVTGSVADASAVTQVASGATGTVTHVTTSQILIHTITGTFNATDQIYETISVNYVVPSSPGHHAMIEFQCGNFALNDNVGIIGATVDATHYRMITTTPAAHCRGVSRDVSSEGFQISSAASGTIRIAEPFFAVHGIGIKNTAANPSVSMPVALVAGGRIVLDEFVSHNADTASSTYNLDVSRPGAAIRITNFIAYSGSRQIDSRGASSVEMRNGVFFSTTDQLVVVASSEATIDNVYAGKPAGSAQDFWTGGAAPAGSNNISSDATASIDFTDSLINMAPADQFVSIAFATADLHLTTGSDCEGAGTPFLQIPLDIDGDIRDSISTDVGADEFVAAGGGSADISPLSIPSAEIFGALSISVGSVIIVTPSILTAELFGTSTIFKGVVDISPVGIASEGVFGAAALSAGGSIISPVSLASTEVFGLVTVIVGSITILPSSIVTSEVFGLTALSGDVLLAPIGISSGEVFGNASLSGVVILNAAGIASLEVFGSALILPGIVELLPVGIVSGAAFGLTSLTGGTVSDRPRWFIRQKGRILGTVTLNSPGLKHYKN